MLHENPYFGNSMGWNDFGWHWFMGFHGILTLLLLAAIVTIGFAICRDMRRNRTTDTAVSVLENRYAVGEIDRAEFLQKRQELT